MSGYDLLFCEMPLPDTGLGPETLFCTRACDGVFSDFYRITADGRLLGLFEELPPTANRPGQPAHGAAAAGYPAEGDPLTWNGDIEFWSLQRSRQVFFACLVDGRCVRILPEDNYRAPMEKGRRYSRQFQTEPSGLSSRMEAYHLLRDLIFCFLTLFQQIVEQLLLVGEQIRQPLLGSRAICNGCPLCHLQDVAARERNPLVKVVSSLGHEATPFPSLLRQHPMRF